MLQISLRFFQNVLLKNSLKGYNRQPEFETLSREAKLDLVLKK